METVRRLWFIGLIAALGGLSPSARASRILVPGINFSGEDTKVTVPMSLIVDVALEPAAYPGPTPRDIMRKYQQGRDGKYDDRIVPRLDDKDLAAIHDYVLWLKERPENQVGSASQSSGQALFVPEGVSLILRPNLAQYRGIEAVYGTLGGGPPYMPGVFIPGEGWSIPFSARDIRPGTRAVMVIAIDHSNQKKARIMWFDIWHRDGEGRQYGPYEIHVTQAVDQHHRPFRVEGMDPVDVALSYCKGLAPAVTLVAGDAPQNPGLAPPPAGTPLSRIEPRSELAPTAAALLPPEEDVTVRVWDERGDPLQQEVPVDIYSLDERQRPTQLALPVLGPTTAHIRRGSAYAVALAQPGFALDPGPGDRITTLEGRPVIVRRPSANGPTQFDFRRRPLPAARPVASRPPAPRPEPRSRVLGMRQQAPRSSVVATRPPLPGSSSSGYPAAGRRSRWSSSPLPAHQEMVVRVAPERLGNREVPIVWTENGRPIRRSVLKPGSTTIVERFPGSARVVPRVGSRRWKIDRERGSDWQTQYVALPQRGGR